MEWYSYLLIFMACVTLFTFGYSQGWNQATVQLKILDGVVQESQDFIFLCNPYTDSFRNCNGTKFMNVTGLYCNNISVCENALR